jgi:hypothetical protein
VPAISSFLFIDILDHSSSIERLTMSIITLSLKIFLPNVSERIQMLLGDGQHLFKDVPIDNI